MIYYSILTILKMWFRKTIRKSSLTPTFNFNSVLVFVVVQILRTILVQNLKLGQDLRNKVLHVRGPCPVAVLWLHVQVENVCQYTEMLITGQPNIFDKGNVNGRTCQVFRARFGKDVWGMVSNTVEVCEVIQPLAIRAGLKHLAMHRDALKRIIRQHK